MYTSNSEFDLETRVQITNEIPTVRTYQQMHHSLQNDTWKWLIGTEDVDYDLPVGGKYIEGVDEEGNTETREIVQPPIKIVNGKQAAVYGPSKSEKWNPDTESYEEYIPTFHRTEIKGTLTVEQDLFLHEIYRYLNCIYPDHPDWLNLLTRNEVLDAFNNAAAMVDYKPNNEFFKLVADSIGDVDGSEEFKLNLRNLTSNAARRKFFGSTLGYRMTGHDAYQDIMVFPIGKNLTIAPQTMTQEVVDDTVIYKKSNLPIKEYIIDTFDERYQTLFRRIDFNGDSRDTSFVSNNTVTVPSYVVPGSEDFVFEFVSSKDGAYSLADYSLVKDNAYSFFKNYNDDLVGSIVGTKQYNILEPVITTSNDRKYVSYISSDDKIFGLQTSAVSKVPYLKLYKYKTLDELEQFQLDYNIYNVEKWVMSWENGRCNKDTEFFASYLSSIYNYCANYDFLADFANIRDTVDYSYNAFIKDTICLPPTEMIKLYGETQYDEKGNAISSTYPELKGASIEEGDFISFEDFYRGFGNVYEVAGASYGTIDVNFKGDKEVNNYIKLKNFKPFDTANDTIISDDSNTIVIKNRDGDYIVFHGCLRCFWSLKVDGVFTAPYLSAIKFVIKAIPEKKSDHLFKLLFGTEAYDLIDEINEDIAKNTRDLNRARELLLDNEATVTGQPFTTYETLSAKESLTDDERIELKSAVAKLEEYLYSYWEDYKSAKERLDENNEELAEAQSKVDELKKNKELLVKDDQLTIGYNCEVVMIGNTSEDGTYGQYSFNIEPGYIEQFNLGNISVLPIDPSSEDIVRIERHYKNKKGEKFDYNLAELDLTKNPREISQEGQLYSKILDKDRAMAFKSTVKFEIYNEKTYTVTAQVFVDKQANEVTYEMQFITDDAKKKFESISIGSKVYGPGIGDAYIVEIGDNSVKLNTSIPKAGYLTYHFECPVTTSPSDVKDDPFNYKKVMNDLGIYDKVSFFDHGVYGSEEWPDVSAVVFDGDLKDKQILNPTTFRKVVKYLYGDKLDDESTQYLTPSIAKYTRDIFVDIKADKLISSKNHFGHTENLMNVEWLDYIQNNNELALAKENVNVGANIILNTDLSGYASLIKDSDYTDTKLKTLFQTNNWDETTMPAYVQIGIGGANYKSFFKLMSDIYYPNVYGATFWDRQVEPIVAGEEGGEGIVSDWTQADGTKVKKRSTYAKVNTLADASSIYKTYENIDSPIFEIPLNEYNIQYKTSQNGKTFTIIDALFYEQGFKNITKSNDLEITKSSQLYANFIDAYPSVESKGASIADGIKYYYFSDGSKEGENKADFRFTILKNTPEGGTPSERWVDYTIWNGGVFGAQVYHYSGNFYDIVGAGPFADVKYINIKDTYKKTNILKEPKELLRKLLMLKTFYNYNSKNVDTTYVYKTHILSGVEIVAELPEFPEGEEAKEFDYTEYFINGEIKSGVNENTFTGNWTVKSTDAQFVSALAAEGYLNNANFYLVDPTYYEPYRGTDADGKKYYSLVLFSYIKGNWDVKENGDPCSDSDLTGNNYETSKEDDFADFFGYKTFDTIGLLWNGDDVQLVDIYKNYTICTSDAIVPLPLIQKSEENLFYGYYKADMFSIYSNLRINAKQSASQAASAGNKDAVVWYAINNDLSKWALDIENSFINYSYTIFNTINLPRKYIANGSYNINLFIDPQFIGDGYNYDEYLNGNMTAKKFNISQSAIKYDSDNDLFYTFARTYDGANFSDTNEKIVIKFEEQKYFKDLKFLFGSYQTSNTQFEGSTDITKEAYIKGITLQAFKTDDLSTSDKFVYAQEVDLRSIYMPLLNSRVFQGTRNFCGEIYGITADGDFFVSGKRTQPLSRLFDKDVLTALSDITPATVDGNGNVNKLTYYEGGVDFDADTELTSPVYKTVKIKKSINPRYQTADIPEFKYFKNLLVFEGLINLKRANVIEAPEEDSSMFNLVTQMLANGDSIEGAAALSGGSYNTHTIVTNLKERARWVAAKDSNVFVLTAQGAYQNTSPINWESTNSVNLTKIDNFPELEGTVTNVVWDDDENAFIATLGRTPTTDDRFGFLYYKSSVAVALTADNDGQPNEVFASMFTTNQADRFVTRKDGINIIKDKVFNVPSVKVGYNVLETDPVNPNDVAIKYLNLLDNDENASENDYGSAAVGSTQHLVMGEGPYIPREPDVDAGEYIKRSLYSTGDFDIAMVQEYMFIKSKLYKVDSDGEYTRDMTSERHWKVTKLPVILDNTELFLKSKTLTGTNSVYNYVKKVYDTFADWAFAKDSSGNYTAILTGEDIDEEHPENTEVSFAGVTLAEKITKGQVETFINAVKDYMEHKFLDFNQFKAKCKYYDANGVVNYFEAENTRITVDASNYTSIQTPITKIVCDTELPLDENFVIDTSASYKIEGTTDDYILQSKSEQNYVNFDDMYYQYATIVMEYLIGEVVSENFGTGSITEVKDAGSKIFFRTFNDDFFFIEKDKLYKYEDVSNMANWKVALFPAGTYIRGSYPDTMSAFNCVKVKVGDKAVEIPVSARTFPLRLFRLTTDMHIAADGKHIFFGGYTIPFNEIKNAVALAGGDINEVLSDTLLQANLETWMNDTDKTGKAPVIVYSDDTGKTFKMLPLRDYVDESLFSNKNFEIASFADYEDKLLAYVKHSEGGFETNQIVISYNSATGDVDTEATEWKSLSIASDGKIHNQEVGDGIITWSDGRLGFGTDINNDDRFGADTLNIDYTGSNVLTIPSGLVVTSATPTGITLNKGINSGNMSSGKLRVLFSISTKTDIADPTQYLLKDPSKLYEYKNKYTSFFKVPSITSVNTADEANRIYSSRYIGKTDAYENEIFGYPTVDEDTNHIYYEYEIDDDSGKIGNVKPLKNNFGNEIKLCTEDGQQLIFEKQVGDSKEMSLYSLELIAETSLNIYDATTAGKNVASTNDALTDISTMGIDKTLTSDEFTYSLKLFDITDNSAIITTSCDILNDKNLIDDVLITFKTDKELDKESEMELPESEAISELQSFIETVEGSYGSSDNKFVKDASDGIVDNVQVVLPRLVLKLLNKEDNTYTYALYDNKYKCYVLKSRRYIDGMFVIPYTFYNGGNGISIIADPSIEYKDDGDNNIATMVGDGALSSGIYYHPMGYGGLRNNKSITNNTPWDRDPAAFENRLLKNSLGNYVYLTDGVGNLIDVYNSIKIANGDETIKYSDFLNNGANIIRHGNTLKECYNDSNTDTYFKLYKLNETDFHIVNSLSSVSSGCVIKIRIFNNTRSCKISWGDDLNFYKSKDDFTNDNIAVTASSVSGDELTFGDVTYKGKIYKKIGITYDLDSGEFTNEEITLELDAQGSIDTPAVHIKEEDVVIFHNDNDSYTAISQVGEDGNIKAKFQLVIEGGYTPSCDLGSVSITAAKEADTWDIEATLGMTEYKDVIIKVNGKEVYIAPIFEIKDKIFKKLNGDSYDYYIGDSILPSEFETFRANAESFNIIDISDYKPLTYGASYEAGLPAGTIIIGLYGKSISKAPKYKNFSDLIYYENVFIYKDEIESFINANAKIDSVADDYSSVKLTAPLSLKDSNGDDIFEKYNDDNEHYFLFKILTVSHQSAKPENMNNPEYYYELGLKEMTTYPPDRVWFNPKGSPKPPVTVGTKIFNNESNYAYYNDEYLNANNFKIRLCDEEGHYINYDNDGNEYRLDDGDGNCSKYVFSGFDGRYISPKPVNATCQEWYKNNIWSKNKDVNPLWQIINVKSSIKNKKWVQNVTLNKYTKSGDNQVMTTDIQYPYVTVNDITKIYVKDDIIYFLSQAENFDIEKGELQLLLSSGSDYYSENDDITMYGLHFTTEAYKSNIAESQTKATLQASYTVNTLRDFSINVQENNTIAEITELGIFDKNHKLIAYANFPPVEYRTDTQHAAFTCIVYHGDMAQNIQED